MEEFMENGILFRIANISNKDSDDKFDASILFYFFLPTVQ